MVAGIPITNEASNAVIGFISGVSNSTVGFATDLLVVSDVVYRVDLTAGIEVDPFIDGQTNGYASIDPIISISSTFPDVSEFQLELSPGIGNSPASVPEPGSIGLLCVGLVGLPLTCRRKAI
jgi:hypothetical protein